MSRRHAGHRHEGPDGPPPPASGPEQSPRPAKGEPAASQPEPAPPPEREAPGPGSGPEVRQPEPAQVVAPQDLLAAKTHQCQELTDQLQRLAAEFSNYQKRTAQRIEDERRDAVAAVVLDLLPALDDLERTLHAARESPDFKVLMDGVELVHKGMMAALKKHGITPIESAGEEFNPEHHEAIAHVPSDDHPSGRVIREVQRGYRHHGRTLRASRVAVSSGKPQAGAGPQQSTSAADESSAPSAAGESDKGEPDANL